MIKLKDILNESDDLTTAKAKIIANLTGTRWEAVEDFFYDYNIDWSFMDYMKKAPLKVRMDFASALSGKPNNKYLQAFVKKFGRPTPKYEIKEETGDSAEDFAKQIEKVIKKHFPTSTSWARYSNRIGESIFIGLAIGTKSDWSNGILENAPVEYRAFVWGVKGGVTTDKMVLETTDSSITTKPIDKPYHAYGRIKVKGRKTTGDEDKILAAVDKHMMALKKAVKDNLNIMTDEHQWVKKYV